ncbi:MAG: AAA family ATPase, partial [Lachnospiraceae bacterium]|nr:AAA family ATPase [Lachnospiraceae bacterium]
MYIQRHAEEAVAKLEKMFGAILVAGPRQVGKTTMLRNITGSDVGYITLDDPIYLVSAVEQSNTFFKDNPPPVFIDEVQRAPELFPQIKMLIDRDRKKGQFYLCGSQQFHIMKNVSESLEGRLGMLTLLGLSLRERTGCGFTEPFLPDEAYYTRRRTDLPEVSYVDIWEMIHRGSMPELCVNPDYDWRMFYGASVRTYIE